MNLPLSDAKLLRNGAYVDGNWIETTAHGSYALRNPATGEILAELPRFQVAETRMAIDAAWRAFQSWKKTSAESGLAPKRTQGLHKPIACALTCSINQRSPWSLLRMECH
jgi:hypothetical protein